MWTGPAWLRVVRDVLCMVIGAGGMVWQLAGGKPDVVVLGFLAVLMYAPGLLVARSLTQPGTGGESSPSLPLSPSQSSSTTPQG